MQGPLAVALLALVAVAAAPPSFTVRVTGARPTSIAPPRASAAGLALYAERCAMCHGAGGAGDGPAAKGLVTKPRRFSDAGWHEVVDDAHIAKAILSGGFAVKKSAAMPAHPDLAPRVDELVRVVRSFRSTAGAVRVDAVDAAGVVVATGAAEVDRSGAASVQLPLVDGTYELIARASGRPEPVCRAAVTASASSREATCAAGAATPGAPTTSSTIQAGAPTP